MNDLLTIVIPVKNEELNLPECLEAIKDLANVVVVDSGSTDSTCKIAADYGREVVQFKWDGRFPKKRNWILRNYKFKTPWVMFLDADERPGDGFWKEVRARLPNSDCDAYIIFLDNWFMGRLLRHGDTARKTAILRIGAGEYERIEEQHWSQLDMEVHEHMVVKGKIGKIKTHIEHYDKRTLTSYIAKHNDYSSWGAYRHWAIRDRRVLNFRQKLTNSLYSSPLLPFMYFFYCYVVRLGFLDGYPGFCFSVFKLGQFAHCGAKAWMVKRGFEC